MKPTDQHPLPPDVSFDGGDLDCGNGLLLLIRKHIDPMARGPLLEIRSTEISVRSSDSPCASTNPIAGAANATASNFASCESPLASYNTRWTPTQPRPRSPARSRLICPTTIERESRWRSEKTLATARSTPPTSRTDPSPYARLLIQSAIRINKCCSLRFKSIS